jgi:hypothetical protein
MTTPRTCLTDGCRRVAHVSHTPGVVFGLCDTHLGAILAFDTGHRLDELRALRAAVVDLDSPAGAGESVEAFRG